MFNKNQVRKIKAKKEFLKTLTREQSNLILKQLKSLLSERKYYAPKSKSIISNIEGVGYSTVHELKALAPYVYLDQGKLANLEYLGARPQLNIIFVVPRPLNPLTDFYNYNRLTSDRKFKAILKFFIGENTINENISEFRDLYNNADEGLSEIESILIKIKDFPDSVTPIEREYLKEQTYKLLMRVETLKALI